MRAIALSLLRLIGLERPARALHLRLQPWGIRRNAIDDRCMEAMLPAILVPSSNVVDIGAHAGGFLEEVHALAPRGQHVAFEPLPEFAGQLRARFPGATVLQAAVGAQPGIAKFTRMVDAPAYSGLRQRIDGRSEQLDVPVVTLDAAIPEGHRVDLIKIDVEGGEMDVFRGGLATLTTQRPFIVFEHGSTSRDVYGERSEDLFELLDKLEYTIVDFDGLQYKSETFSTAKRWNFLAVPRSRVTGSLTAHQT